MASPNPASPARRSLSPLPYLQLRRRNARQRGFLFEGRDLTQFAIRLEPPFAPGRLQVRTTGAQEISSCGSGTLLGTGNVGAGGTATFRSLVSPRARTTLLPCTAATALWRLPLPRRHGNHQRRRQHYDHVDDFTQPGFDGQNVTLVGTVAPVPTGSSLGTIAFCDSGTPDVGVHRSFGAKTPRSPRALRRERTGRRARAERMHSRFGERRVGRKRNSGGNNSRGGRPQYLRRVFRHRRDSQDRLPLRRTSPWMQPTR